MKKMFRNSAQATFILFASALVFSCGNKAEDQGLEYAPDMYHSVAYDPFSQVGGFKNPNNPHGMNMRTPAAGTIARGQLSYVSHIGADSAEIAGRVLSNPFEANEKNLEKGKVLYTRFCSHCHGETGQGDGLVGQKFKGVPSYSQGRVSELAAGHIFHVITNGKGRMMPHGSQLNPDERWKIVMYVQTLQKPEEETAGQE